MLQKTSVFISIHQEEVFTLDWEFIDTMQFVKPDVATICTGMAASMGAVLLCAGAEGKRSALPHSRVMIHQPSGGAQGVATDMEINLKEMLKLKDELYEIISKHSGSIV